MTWPVMTVVKTKVFFAFFPRSSTLMHDFVSLSFSLFLIIFSFQPVFPPFPETRTLRGASFLLCNPLSLSVSVATQTTASPLRGDTRPRLPSVRAGGEHGLPGSPCSSLFLVVAGPGERKRVHARGAWAPRFQPRVRGVSFCSFRNVLIPTSFSKTSSGSQ